MATALVGKISIASIGGNPKGIFGIKNEPGAFFKVATVYGVANGLKTVVDKNKGESWEAITGDFEAVNQDGETFHSGVLYLPSGIHESVLGKVKELQEGESVRFAFEIQSVHATNLAKYSYRAVPLLPPESISFDPLDEIRKLLAPAAVPALPGPTAPAAQTEAPKTHPAAVPANAAKQRQR